MQISTPYMQNTYFMMLENDDTAHSHIEGPQNMPFLLKNPA